jgi:ribose/xylose/arabinose/galactoside ABC-type transport system permease subunit
MSGLRWRPPASLWAAAVLFAVLAAFVPRFATLGNLENVLRVASILCIAACGQAVVLVMGAVEFSFGASAALASVVTVLLVEAFGTAAGFAGGAATVVLVSLLNGLLVARLGLPSVLATLGTLMAAAGAAATLAGGLPLDAPPDDAFSWPARGEILGIPVPMAAAGLSLAVLYLLLERTRLGRGWSLIGANAGAARQAGLAVGRMTVFGFLVAGGFAAVAAVILTSRVASGQPALAPNLAFETIAACAIGGISLAGGKARAAEVACGVLILAMMNNAVVLLNLPAAAQLILLAAAILGAVLAQRMGHLALGRLRGRRRQASSAGSGAA